ncbi:HAD-IIB family hydrolase (plasmid) [Shinella sumterensis]|nr:HAD-IIB family hydrolase [Shinella sumterensis]
MRPLDELSDGLLTQVQVVLTDIDDTLTSEGQLRAEPYAALQALARAGFAVVPITGRPAGWCDMIARFWPVAGVVGENGAFYFSYDRGVRKMRQAFFATEQERRENRRKLDALRDRILQEVPGTGIASDQLYREADLAIDVCEDVEPLPQSEVERVLALFKEAGAVAKLSSIHVNGWFGSYDKLSMTRRFAADVLGMDLDADKARFIFTGDSPNDGPMFSFFPNSCGVANVTDFAGGETALPAFVASERGGEGFVQIASRLLAVRPSEIRERAHA